MKTFDEYQAAANLTCSPEFYGEGVDPIQLTVALKEAAAACQRLDAIKRSLFYSDRLKFGLNQEGEVILPDQQNIDILHAVIGLVTEVGEIAEGYVNGVDPVNLKEEGGDLMWYLALLAHGLERPMSEMADANIRKLKVRYGEAKFSEHDALNRDLDQEMAALTA